MDAVLVRKAVSKKTNVRSYHSLCYFRRLYTKLIPPIYETGAWIDGRGDGAEGSHPWREAGPPNHHDDKVDSDQ